MTDELGTEILKELRKLNGFMEAVDWKLWNMHKKLVEEGGDINTPTTTKDTVNPSVTVPATTVTDEAPVVPAIPKYPSIEKWS